MPPKKPKASLSSLIAWGGLSLAGTGFFWNSFVRGLRTGEFLGSFQADLGLALCATVLLICVAVEAWKVFRPRK